MPTSTSSHRITKPPTKRGVRRASRKSTQPTSSPTVQSHLEHRPQEQPTPITQPQSQTQPLVERTNALPLSEFINLYAPEDDLHIINPANAEEQQQQQQHYAITIYTAATLPPGIFTQCFQLIETTSAEAYRASSIGWSPSKKRKEMQLPDMKYLILRRADPQEAALPDAEVAPPIEEEEEEEEEEVLGFLSFMVTYEDGFEVVYCYEVHLAAAAQRQGLGARLMRVFLRIGEQLGMAKSMLTVFRANEAAIRFYERLGFGVDESSPRPRRLRNGTVKDPDYRILSRAYARE
ncbi:acyl-CoA N-acyltransferase [Aspergillus uvarum CBS 121591]|uniref:N-alpha-acetyltransferase 40 n=1 Tax=Aspergillus uvarum CBS 121591 TaxID=1448315 RepID=A0A319CS70_9EURO|nr:acyl-CoA N-acyltransferase [Aspergillus uvarum CBS 121591]PYH78408.1 acyl-CoA N-acyltransferase [Aspergillus uvarum CBS 121591]